MKWTKEPPTEPGWYWYRHALGSDDVVAEIKDGRHGLLMFVAGDHTWRHFVAFSGEWWPIKIEPPEDSE